MPHKDAAVADAQHVRQARVDTSGNAVQRGVCGIDGYAMPYGLLHGTCLRTLAAYLLQTVEKQRMMGDDELTPQHNSFIDHLRRNVCGQEDGLYITSCVTYLHARVIPFFLGTPWRYRLYAIDNGS